MASLNIVTLDMLTAIPLFHDMRTELAEVLKDFCYQTFQSGDAIFHAGEIGDTMYILLGGSVEVIKQGKVVAELKPHDYFGEMALLSDHPRNATIQVKEDCKLVSLSKKSFEHILQTHPNVAMHISDTILKRSK